MPLTSIDLAEIGTYQPGAVCPHASRKEAAQLGAYVITDMGGGLYQVRRSGGGLHSVRVCLAAGVYHAECDCYDWVWYGAGFRRACVHVWRVILTQAVGGC